MVLKLCVIVSNGGVAISPPRAITGKVATSLEPSKIFSYGGFVARIFSRLASACEEASVGWITSFVKVFVTVMYLNSKSGTGNVPTVTYKTRIIKRTLCSSRFQPGRRMGIESWQFRGISPNRKSLSGSRY